jgi:RNA polymerase sigma-70 factor (ECF subfamily)
VDPSATPRTSARLLGRLRTDATDQAAWAEFVYRCGRRIHQWCRQWNVQEADAQDLTQTVLTELAAKMRTFTYDPSRSFRAYLKTLTHFACCDVERVQQQVEPHTWEAYRLTAVERLSGAAAAARLDMQVMAVFKAKSKVLKLLHKELENLERGSGLP